MSFKRRGTVSDSERQSAIADELFANGVSSFEKGNYEFGQELIQDALAFYEQIFGGVHSETSSQFHTLGISEDSPGDDEI